jgi:single-strand DNA-binding protein
MINRVILVGRITKDAEIKKTQSGISSCRFTLAVDKKDGADFINCQSWRQSADFMGYCKKGDIVGVDGRLTTYSYERDGRKTTVTEVIADTVRRIYGKKVEVDAETEMPLEMPLNELEKELPF